MASYVAAAHHPAVEASLLDEFSHAADEGPFEEDYDGMGYSLDEAEADDGGDESSQLYARWHAKYLNEADYYYFDDDDDDWLAEYEPVFVSAHRIRTQQVPEEDGSDYENDHGHEHELFRRKAEDDPPFHNYLGEVDTNEEEFNDEIIPKFYWADMARAAPKSGASPAAKVIPAPTPAPSPKPATLTTSDLTVGALAGDRLKSRT
ncbi:Hypothetical protein D9617_6g094740 [Elsinoe fawcettii]|nr:Hypothetical protein D9617_6g094740 [Elsinoe fawcettii]